MDEQENIENEQFLGKARKNLEEQSEISLWYLSKLGKSKEKVRVVPYAFINENYINCIVLEE